MTPTVACKTVGVSFIGNSSVPVNGILSLDIFRRAEHNSLTVLNIVDFRYQPKELIAMYSEALRIMDENTVKFMIDELKAALSQMNAEMDGLREKLAKYEKQEQDLGNA